MAESPIKRGAFIVFEGLDRSGKSTQVSRLLDKLHVKGKLARLQKFPDRTTTIGAMINTYLQSQTELDDRAIHLLFSANRWECANAIIRDLAEGITVIADRYAFSGIAFSAAKGLPFDFCLNPEKGLPLPDLTLYFSLPPDVASSRAAYGAERYESVEIQELVRAQFELVASEVRKKHCERQWVEVDASESIDEVAEHVWNAVEPLLTVHLGTIETLWS